MRNRTRHQGLSNGLMGMAIISMTIAGIFAVFGNSIGTIISAIVALIFGLAFALVILVE